MKQINYNDWKNEFNKLTKKYLESINWETIVFDENDFGCVGDDLQSEAYVNVHITKFDDSDYDLSEWESYDESCGDRTDFQMDIKNDWEEQKRIRK